MCNAKDEVVLLLNSLSTRLEYFELVILLADPFLSSIK